MKYFLLTLCLFTAATCSLPLQAQRRKTVKKEPQVPIEQLFQEYRFEEAANQLQKQLETAEKKGEPTDSLEAYIKRANLGADMLRGTERITFVDSFKVHRNAVLSVIRLSHEAGRLVDTQSPEAQLRTLPASIGQYAYINELEDRMFCAVSQKKGEPQTISQAFHVGKDWGAAETLDGMTNGNNQANPFMMPDGATLYFAQQGEESLGGYDLFVTRYNSDTKQFLKPENLGMPFNSPANDYLLAIDEATRIGWLVTDRYQHADTVCVYTFVPNESRNTYILCDENRDEVVRAAQLRSIRSTQLSDKLVAAARQRIQLIDTKRKRGQATATRYVINDQKVYTSLKEFQSSRARSLAAESDRLKEEIEQLTALQEDWMRKTTTPQTATEARKQLELLYPKLIKLQQQYNATCKQMRQEESKQ